MKKLLWIVVLCVLLAACGRPNTDIPEGYYSGPSEEAEEESADPSEKVPVFFVEETVMSETTEYRICRQNVDGSLIVVAELGPANNTPFFLLEDRLYYTAGGSLFSVDFDGENRKALCDNSEKQVSFDRIIGIEEGFICCKGSCWQEITNDPAALPGPHRAAVVAKAKADLSGFEILEQAEGAK